MPLSCWVICCSLAGVHFPAKPGTWIALLLNSAKSSPKPQDRPKEAHNVFVPSTPMFHIIMWVFFHPRLQNIYFSPWQSNVFDFKHPVLSFSAKLFSYFKALKLSLWKKKIPKLLYLLPNKMRSAFLKGKDSKKVRGLNQSSQKCWHTWLSNLVTFLKSIKFQ